MGVQQFYIYIHLSLHNHIMWASWRDRSPATQPFAQELVQANDFQSSTLLVLCEEIPLVDHPPKGVVMRKEFPYHDVVIIPPDFLYQFQQKRSAGKIYVTLKQSDKSTTKGQFNCHHAIFENDKHKLYGSVIDIHSWCYVWQWCGAAWIFYCLPAELFWRNVKMDLWFISLTDNDRM